MTDGKDDNDDGNDDDPRSQSIKIGIDWLISIVSINR